MKKHYVTDVFTPTSPARLTFVEREEINKRIVRALRTTGNQIVVYGYSGCGKTTLIENKLYQLYEHHVRTNCMLGMSYESVLLDAFDQLAPYYVDNIQESKNKKIGANIEASYALIKAQITSEAEKSNQASSSRVLPPQLTAQSLARFMGAAKSCWVLEDFHKLEEKEKRKLAQLMKVFMDMSSEYADLKIVYVGAVNTAREVVQLDKEMRRRVSEINVPLMSDKEIGTIMRKGFSLLNIGVTDRNLAIDLFNHCSGLPSICHKLCLLMCEDLNVTETVLERQSKDPYDYIEGGFDDEDMLIDEFVEDELNDERISESEYLFEEVETNSGVYATNDNLKYALLEYLEDESDTIKCAFDRAFKENYAEDILESLSESDKHGARIEEIIGNLQDIHPIIKREMVEKTLLKLTEPGSGGLVKYAEDSGYYSFIDQIHRTFAVAYYQNKLEHSDEISNRELMKVFNKAFGSIKREFSGIKR